MDTQDRQAIRALFDKLAQVGRQMPARDAEAEAFINACTARQPEAAYYMAQTVVVQQQALNVAQARIDQLQAELADARASQSGGFLSGLFDDDPVPRRPGPAPQMPQAATGGFLAGAVQTAMGVAGGMVLANAIAGLFAGEALADVLPETEPPSGDGGFADDSDW